MTFPRTFLSAPLAALLLVSTGAACAQSHTQQFGAYTLQSSSVNSEHLSVEAAREHGIEPGPGVAVLNVVVQKNDSGKTVPAQVEARVSGLAGVVNQIPMRETRAQGRVAYTGTYPILPRQVVDITVTARLEGAAEPLSMTYRERMWTNVNAP